MKSTILIHIPRTAGTSITRTVEQMEGITYQRNHCNVWTPNTDFTDIGHRSVSDLIQRKIVTVDWWSNSFKFAFVRNPWDRLVSLYEYLRSFRIKTKPNADSTKTLGCFSDFVRAVTESSQKFVKPLGIRNVRCFSQARPQVEWLQWGVDYVGQFESLEDDWKIICDLIEIPCKKLLRENTTKTRKDYRSYYTDDDQALVSLYYSDDIMRFNYEFDPPLKSKD